MPNSLIYAAHRLRTGRRSEPNRIYLITAITAQRQPVFADLYCARVLINALRKASADAHSGLCGDAGSPVLVDAIRGGNGSFCGCAESESTDQL